MIVAGSHGDGRFVVEVMVKEQWSIVQNLLLPGAALSTTTSSTIHLGNWYLTPENGTAYCCKYNNDVAYA